MRTLKRKSLIPVSRKESTSGCYKSARERFGTTYCALESCLSWARFSENSGQSLLWRCKLPEVSTRVWLTKFTFYKTPFYFLTSNGMRNEGSIWSYRMYRGIVYMWLRKGWGSPLRKSAFKRFFYHMSKYFSEKGVRYLTTECLSLRQESDKSDMFDII